MTADGLSRADPRTLGIDAGAVVAFLDDVESSGLELHSIMVHRHGHVGVEGWRWPYRADRPRMTHSFTKSVLACAIGLAIDEGYFKLTDKVISFFPDQLPAVIDDKLRAMTVEDLLTMRTGQAEETSGSIWRAISTSWIAEFFKIPIVHQPGTSFVYTSAASYMLAAILSKATGQTTHAFLKPRLLEPLGITGESWDIGPDGINPGGNGFTCTTPGMLKFGILHAQGGMWEGRRLLPETWVAAATRRHGSGEYGYHWVVYEDGVYGALGIFVQMVLVFPQAGAALCFTGAIDGSKRLLPFVRKHFNGAFARPRDDAAARASDAVLKARLAAFAAQAPVGATSSPLARQISARSYRMEVNAYGVRVVGFQFAEERCTFRLIDAEGEYNVVAGLGGWIESRTDITGRDLHHGYRLRGAVVVASAQWRDEQTLEMTWIFAETAFRDTVVCRFQDGTLTLDRSVNINSGLRSLPTLHGTLLPA
ncbi:MAG: beta-lactamase family protein [Rhodospirillaceae bacterium]|nr:beta-lactamase family protein [Rhodospirillaceae bacterium]